MTLSGNIQAFIFISYLKHLHSAMFIYNLTICSLILASFHYTYKHYTFKITIPSIGILKFVDFFHDFQLLFGCQYLSLRSWLYMPTVPC